MRIPFVGPTYQHRSARVSAQRCINLYPEINEGEGGEEKVISLQPTPGARRVIADPIDPLVTPGGYKAVHVTAGGVFIGLINAQVIKIFPNGTVVMEPLMTDLTPEGMLEEYPAYIADNGTTAVIVNDGAAASLTIDDPAPSLVMLTLGFYPSQVKFVDGYFIFLEKNSGRHYFSELYSTTVDLLDYFTAEGSPDNGVALKVLNRELWCFGVNTTEVFYNTGDADRPFQPLQGAFIEVGTLAPASVVKVDGILLWVSKSEFGEGMVVINNGYSWQRVSTHAIEQLLNTSPSIEDSIAYGYQKEGHSFYCLNVPGLDTTLVYDLATRMWHERAVLNAGVLTQEPFNRFVSFRSAGIRFRPGSATLFSTENDIPTVDGESVPRIRSAPSLRKEMRLLQHNSFQLDIQTGVGLAGSDPSSPAVAPVAELRWSNDSGQTWTDPIEASIGRVGEYEQRAIWRRLGTGRDRVYEVRIVAPVLVSILGAVADVVALRS